MLCLILGPAGGAQAAGAADWSTQTIGGSRVHLYLPDAAGRIGSGHGLLIALHGCTQSNDVLRDRGNFEPAAEAYGLVIALPNVPNGGVLAGCWDYYGANHARSGRHDGYLLALVDSLLGDATLAIDRRQVYLAGLSSGAGEAMVMGCLAPDVFAGVGINAGPAVGTEASQIATVATTLAEAQRACLTLAGGSAGDFSTQLAAVVAGTRDYVVAQGYAALDAQIFAAIYAGAGPALSEAPIDLTTLPGYQPRGSGTTWSDGQGARVQLLMLEGMGHAFPAGSGPGPEISFVASAGVSWPMALGELFTVNNRRVEPGTRLDAGAPGADGGGGAADAAPGRRDSGTASSSEDAGVTVQLEPAGCACETAPAGAGATPLLYLLAALAARAARKRTPPTPPTSG